MKIGIDIRTLMDARYSGVSEYTLNLVKEILKLDTENEYRLFYNCWGDCVNMPEFKQENVRVVKYNYPNKILNYLLFKIFNYPKIDKELEIDLFFMPHINFIGLSKNPRNLTPTLSLVRRGGSFIKGGVRSVITVHDLSFMRYPEFFSARKNFWHKMVNVKKLLKKFDVVVAVSENTKRDVVELCGVDAGRVKVIYSGVSNDFKKLQITNYLKVWRSHDKLQITKKYNLPDKFILYLGTLEPRKNVDGIIKAYNELRIKNYELRNFKLIIAGAKGWKADKIYQEWERSEFKDDIRFLDYVDGQDKVYLYNLADVFVYPSFYEGFGLPPLEAMACGLPLVASYASSLPEVAGEAALMVDPYDINDIARAMKEVLTDENLKNKLVARGLERAKKFSWEKAAGEYLSLFAGSGEARELFNHE